MKKKWMIIASAVVMTLIIGGSLGCGSNKSEAESGQDNTGGGAESSEANNSSASAPDMTQFDVDKYIVTLGDYKNVTTDAQKAEVTDDYVNSAINYYFGSYFVNEPSDKQVVELGDTVNIDYQGIKDGVAFDGGTAEGYDLTIGSGTFIPGFEEGLIGAEVGSEVALDLTFPEQYQSEELAGAAVIFNVKVNFIGEKKLSEESLQDLAQYNVTNAEELVEYVRGVLESDAESTYANNVVADGINQIIENTVFAEEIPQEIYDYYYNQTKNNDLQAALSNSQGLAEYIESNYSMDLADYEKNLDDYARGQMKMALVLAKISRLEGVEISEDEFEQQITQDATNYGYESVEALKNSIDEQDYRNYMIEQKTKQYLFDNGYIK